MKVQYLSLLSFEKKKISRENYIVRMRYDVECSSFGSSFEQFCFVRIGKLYTKKLKYLNDLRMT